MPIRSRARQVIDEVFDGDKVYSAIDEAGEDIAYRVKGVIESRIGELTPDQEEGLTESIKSFVEASMHKSTRRVHDGIGMLLEEMDEYGIEGHDNFWSVPWSTYIARAEAKRSKKKTTKRKRTTKKKTSRAANARRTVGSIKRRKLHQIQENPPPDTRSRKGQMAFGVYPPGRKEEFYLDINRALARTAFLSGVNGGEPVKMRIYESDNEGGWLWSDLFSITTVKEAYKLPAGARAANPATVIYDENAAALIPNLDIELTPGQYHAVITLVREHRASGKYGSNLESWAELEETLTNQASAWAHSVKEQRKIKRRVLR